MNNDSSSVSATYPVTPALERVKAVLFQPFDLPKWFILGFAAFLAQLGEGPWGGGGGGGWRSGGGRGNLQREMNRAREWVLENLDWIIPVGLLAIFLVLAIWVVATWLSSRGKFMFLHGVATNRAEIGDPWNRYGRHGDSLFLFRIVLGLVAFAVFLPCIVGGLFLILGAAASREGAALGLAIGLFIVVMIALGLGFGLISWATSHFVVPIMYLRTSSCMAAWREFFALLSANAGRFVLFALFYFLVSVVLVLMVIALVALTCCILGCIFAIPIVGWYLSAVVLLPLHVFARSLSAYYLAQYGTQYDVFAAGQTDVLDVQP